MAHLLDIHRERREYERNNFKPPKYLLLTYAAYQEAISECGGGESYGLVEGFLYRMEIIRCENVPSSDGFLLCS